jgi:fructokinase
MKKKVVGLGELLWDLLPDRTCLGGAPANFAYITTLLGDRGIVASRLGVDARGRDALRRMEEVGLECKYVQKDPERPTGVVQVQVDGKGIAQYEIAYPVAWDFMEWTPEWQHLAETADAVCYGSLAQRSARSRETIRKFVQTMRRGAVKIFDVNLRQHYYSKEIVADTMRGADIVKLNDDELPKIMALLGFRHEDEPGSARQLSRQHGVGLVCITRGARGSLLVRGEEVSEHCGFAVKVADTVGSGDAFTAGMVHEYLRGSSLAQMNETANLVGAWVASQAGAMPTPKPGALEASFTDIRRSCA